jgi:uncharacterized damage-inducible protein DinB
MRNACSIVLFTTLVAAAAALAACQKAPIPPSGQAKELLDSWMNNGNKLIEMAEEFPEDKYDYQPTKEVRSFGEIVRHIAAVNFRYVRQAQGQPYNDDEFAPENFKTKTEIVGLLKKSYQEGAELIQPATDPQMLEAVKNPYGDYTTSRYAFWMQAVEHAAEHYGNLVVYYRLNRMVPPTSRQSDG